MRVLHLGRDFTLALEEYDLFCQRHGVTRLDTTGKTRVEVKQLIQDKVSTFGPIQAILSYGVFSIGKLDEELFSCAVPELKMYASSGAGTDKLDMDFFTKNRVRVSNTPDAVTKSTADGTAILVLSAIKKFSMVFAQAKSDGFWRGNLPLMGDPEDMVVGIIGMGKIGKEVAKRLNAFGTTIVYYNRSRISEPDEKSLNVSYATFDELLQKSDVICLTCPLTAETRHILNKESLSRAKHGVIIVNSARGGCIDTEALIEALKDGQVANAALDVYEDEPNIPQFFKDSDKVLITPHYLAFTAGTMRKIENALLDNLNSYFDTGRPLNAVNELN